MAVNLWGQFFLPLDHCFDSVVHVLHQVYFRPSQPPFVGDVVDMVVGLCVLSVGPADLNVELISNCLELGLLLAQVRLVVVH